MTKHHENRTPDPTKNKRWLLGEWSYWPDSGLLKNKSKRTQLPTQLNEVLSLLINQAPAVVSREEFLAVVWSGKFVNEDALSRAIAELRKELGDSASQAKYIKTIPKKGYQLSIDPVIYQERAKSVTKKWLLTALVVFTLMIVLVYLGKTPVSQRLTQAVANAQKITSKPGMEQQSSLSQSGQWLTYATNSIDQSYITVQALEDANQLFQVELAGYRLASPVYDSMKQTLWFIARNQEGCALMSKNLRSQNTVKWSDCVFQLESATLTADFMKQEVYFSRKDENNRSAIHLLHVSTGHVEPLSQPQTDDQQDWSPSLSPDAQWLSFSRGNQSVRNIWLKNLISGEEQAMTVGEHYSVSHDWFDNEHLIFDFDKNGSRQLWILNINDKSMEPIGGYGAQHPSFAQNKSLMTFQKVDYEANIWQHDLLTGDFKRLVHSTKYDNNPAYAPDGKSFAFTSNRQDVGSIWLYDFKSGSDQLILEIANAKLTRPVWADDGHSLLVTVNDDSGYWTLSFDLKAQKYNRIPFGTNNLAAIKHQGYYYALAKSAEINNQILQLKDGEEAILPIKHVSRFMFLKNGMLVYSKTNEPGLFMTALDTFEEHLLVENFPVKDMNLWTVVNQSVYYDQAGEHAGIYRLHVPDMSLQKVSENRPYSVGTSLSVNHTEEAILITRTDRAESDVFKATIEQ